MYGFLRREPRAGKPARGVPRRGGDGDISSLFNFFRLLEFNFFLIFNDTYTLKKMSEIQIAYKSSIIDFT